LARKILLADDSVTAQNMGRKILADAGYEVITVNNGSAALKKISEQHPDLIVLDVYMPGYSGLEVCQRLKEVPDTSRIPILLTVGKLEPFKPEEARRARADGFIVKPFEASELLSALSKLEDKVVPRSESSKTGRFARASAAIEDSRFDKSMAVEEDSGWKSRIVFPKKKSKPAEEEAEDPAALGLVHKDARPTTEPKPIEKPLAPIPAEETHVDLGALVPAGLPKDVTPEEIAALAAAAAQVKGKFGDEKAPEPVQEMPVVAPAAGETREPEIKAEAPVAEPLPAPAPLVDVPAPAAPAATFAEQSPEEVETKEPEPEVVPSAAAVMATIANLETEAVETPAAGPAHDAAASNAPQIADEPVTMAVAAPIPAIAEPAASRWTAVAVALAPEDAGISLEQEMQKAYAASAALGGSPATVAPSANEIAPTPVVEPSPAEAVPSSVSVESAAQASAPVSTPAEVAPEAAETMSAVANAATDAISAAVAHLESVAAAYVAEKAAAAAQASATEVGEEPATTPEPAAPEKSESVPQVSESETLKTKAEGLPVAEAAAAEEPAKAEEPHREEGVTPADTEALKTEETDPVSEMSALEEAKEEASVVGAPVESTAEVEQPARASTISQAPGAPARVASRAGGSDDMAKRESETAAAWASWRKIRETGNPKPAAETSEESEESSSSSQDAAMAVAAGAEHNSEDAKSLDADPEIASIVDSVLADMRPKIVEEIARKLGKKK